MLFRKIIAVLCSIAISFSLFSAPAAAITVEQGALCVSALQFAYQMYHDWKTDHPDAPDSEYTGFHPGGMFGGGAGRPRPEELEAAYDTYVQDLPATGYSSNGHLTWQPTVNDLSPDSTVNVYYDGRKWVTANISDFPFSQINDSGSGASASFRSDGIGIHIIYYKTKIDSMNSNIAFIPPVPGSYRVLKSLSFSYSGTNQYGEAVANSGNYSLGDFNHYSSDSALKSAYLVFGGDEVYSYYVTSGYSDIFFPIYEVIPDSTLSESTYNTTTRPTSITGGNYGVVGDNNEITKVEDNSTIINETNNTYYNPATGTTVPITDWSYNYTDRSYKVTTESGDTATITYGDENISIQETNTTSGDTVTNNYTIYYLVDAPDQSSCSHNWTETSTTPSTCTVPGSRLLTCSLCSQTKTESIPALGHDWEVKQTVNTQYDETGQLTQQGYTVFECGTCHEQYKSEDGALPPAVNPGTGTDLAAVDALKEKLQIAADALLGIFHKLPELFTGFTDFLAAVFPFVPTEFITIFELGLFLLIAAAALRKFLS